MTAYQVVHNRVFYGCAAAAAAVLFSFGCSNSGPSAEFSAVCAALRCDFTDQSTGDEPITGWEWSLGDGATATDQNLFHLYAEPGMYNVSLTVRDANGVSDTKSETVTTTAPVIGELSCHDPDAPGGFVGCSLQLEAAGGFHVVLVSHDCAAHGNVFRITAPVVDTLSADGCYEAEGKQITVAGPFQAGTEITAEIIAPLLSNPPRLLVSGSYPEWTLTFEDGGDDDFDDLVMTLSAIPSEGGAVSRSLSARLAEPAGK